MRYGVRGVLSLVLALPLAAVVAVTTTAPASAAPPDFVGTLAGPSVAAMYPSGEEYDAVNNRLVVADTGNDRVLFYSLTGTKLGEFGAYGIAPGQFASPRDTAVDEDGNIYVADAENNRIQAFTSTGAFRWSKGGQGQGAENLNTPIGVTWDHQNDVLLVASTSQNKIKAWDANGVFQWQSPVLDVSDTDPGDVSGPRDVTRGPDGKLWVTAYDQHQIKVFDVGADGNWTGHLTPDWVIGSGNGNGVNQMNYPYNVVFSSDGTIAYISDTGNGRILRYDISGPTPVWMAPFGGRCNNHPQPCEDPPVDAGKFNHLRRVAIDPAGNVYAADFWGGGIEVFRPDGTWLRSIEGAEAPTPGFAEAYGVDVAPDGQVYVMDRLNHRVQRFQPNGTYVNKVGARGAGAQPAIWSWPEGLTVGPDGRVWVMDTRGGRLERFESNLSTTNAPYFGGDGAAVGRFNYPSGADVDASGAVWVADTRNHRIQKYDPATNTFSVIGSQGSGPGQFSRPMGVAVTADAVYVADTLNNRVQKLSLSGTNLATFTGLNGPEGVEVAPDGTVWVADTLNNRLVHLSANLVDLGDGFGSLGDGDTQFFNPHDLAFGNDKMYVADTYNDRVQMFSVPGPVEPEPTDLTPSYTGQISDPGGRAPVYPAGVEIVDGTWYVADSGGSRVVTINPTTGAVSPLSATGVLNDPRDLELDAADPTALWVTDTGGNRIVRLSRTGQQLGTIGGGNLSQPYGLANDATRVYVANTYGSPAGVKAFNRNGSVAWNQTSACGTAFSRPRDVGLADNGQLAVADTDNNRIVILNAADGTCVRSFGTNGAGAVQFKSPRSVSADGSGGLWVADAFNYRVQHLTMNGTAIGTTMPAGTLGDGPQQFRSPHCVTPVPGTTEVAVCDTFNFRISVYDGAGTTPAYDRTVGGTRPTNGGFNGAFAVAYGPDGSLYVADWFNHRIQKFDADGDFVTSWGGYGPKDGALIFPRGILVAPSGDVVVTDSENNRIDVFTPSGGFVKSVKPLTGTALSRPHQTALDGSGGYWIADTNNSRILHLGPTGTVLLSQTITGAKPEGIALDANGEILVSNTVNNKVERYSSSGTLLGTLVPAGTGAKQVRKPGGLLVTGTGASRRVWIADAGNHRVMVLDAANAVEASFGSVGAGDGQLTNPRGVAFDPVRERIAVADFGNDRVSLWDPYGDPPPVDTTNPTLAFTAPAGGASLPSGAVGVTGTAADNTSVAGVAVAIQRSSDNRWLQADGTTWGTTQQYVAATLAEAGAASTTWSLSFSATTAGTYAMTARATDQAGNTGTTTRSFTVAPPDSTAPGTTIATPATNAVLAPPTTTATGAATDNVGVASVTILVKDRDTGLWLQNNGTWGSTTANAQRLATLASPGGTSTSWTIDIPLGVGNYLITARARDAVGNQTATAAQKQFSVRQPDSVAPDGTITTPANNATLPMGPVSMTGNATDNIGVDQVLLAIQDTVTKEYLRANGTWSAQYGTVTATVANRGAASSGWSFTFTPPTARKYAVTAIARDAAGNQDATKPRNVFTVQ